METLKSFVLLDGDLKSTTPFGTYFLYSINMLGIVSTLYFIWLLYKSRRTDYVKDVSQYEKAKQMVTSFGRSSMNYFKTYEDKQFYFYDNDQGFISFKETSRYAVVLENPVLKDCSTEAVTEKIKEFESFMLSRNLNTIFYRIPEDTISIYEQMGKKKLLLGEDAYVSLKTFTMEGADAKSLRNAANKLQKEGFVFKENTAPQSDLFIQKLSNVSNDWLRDMEREELGFSQGYFCESELRNQTILTVESADGTIVAFVNIIDNSVPGEVNFDLMRKSANAPNGTMDLLFTEMMQLYKAKGCDFINLGMVPFSGIDKPNGIAEQTLKLAYEKIEKFSHYKSLHFFKEKFKPTWIKVYAVYDTDLDLVNLTTILSKVMDPKKPKLLILKAKINGTLS